MQSSAKRCLKSLSYVFPVYNEEESLPFLRVCLEKWIREHEGLSVEIVLVNDGSRDKSLEFLRKWAHDDARIVVISFSRNFGHQAAVTAGLEAARGEAVVIMDADLQDPFHAVDLMIEKYAEGFDIVYGQRLSREGETMIKRFTAWVYYRLQRSLVLESLPVDTGDFRLVSRVVVDVINSLPEKSRFVRGLFAWVGFSQTRVEYQRDARLHGVTKYPLRKMLAFAWTGITSFSVLPIRFVTGLGFISALMSVAYLFYAVFQYFSGHTVAGWTALVVLQTFIGGCVLLAIGVVGEYVGKIYEEVKARPVYIKEVEYRSDVNDY
jgi:dolichol-phosphate mannosyltransferase